MRILLVSDFSIEENSGGAQRSNKILMDKGVELGHEITYFHHNSDPQLLHDGYDVIISSNLAVISQKEPNIVPWLGGLSNHVRLEHDLNYYLTQEGRQMLFGNCTKTIFMSPLHYSTFQSKYGDIFKNVEIVVDPIDTETFYDKEVYRSDAILYMGFLHELKGVNKFFEFAKRTPDAEFVVYGWGDKKYIDLLSTFPNVNYLGQASYDQVPDIMNYYSSMYYDPVLHEPFCRTVGEALCCGMTILSDSNDVGALELYKEVGLDRFIELVKTAPERFWSVIV